MATMMNTWFPMAVHLIEGFVMGVRRTTRRWGERERLLALGSLSAGLTHELNNPAAAAVRAAATLRQRVAGMRSKLAMLADGTLDATKLHQIVDAAGGGGRAAGEDEGQGHLADGAVRRRGLADRLAGRSRCSGQLGRRSGARRGRTGRAVDGGGARRRSGRRTSRVRCAG